MIPIFLWSKKTVASITDLWGKMIVMEKETEYAKRIDEARLIVDRN